MNLKNQVRQDIQKEADRQDLIEDYGNIMYILGYPVNISLAAVGGFFDALILYSIIFTAFKNHYAAVLVALIGAALLQFLMGRPVMLITKNMYSGKFQTERGFGKMLIMMLIGSLLALAVSLWLSWNTDKIVAVAMDSYYAGQFQSEQEVHDHFEMQRDTLFARHERNKAELYQQIAMLDQQKVFEHGVLVKSHSAILATTKISKVTLPALIQKYEDHQEEIKEEEAIALQAVIDHNSTTDQAKASHITWGGNITRFGNIGINIFRVFIVIFYMIFVLDAQEQPKPEEAINSEQSARTVTEQLAYKAVPTATVDRTAASNSTRTVITEQPQTLVVQKVQPVPVTTEQPHVHVNDPLPAATRTATPKNRTVVKGFQPIPPTEQPEQSTRTVVHQQHTKVIVNNTDLVNLRRKCRLYYLRSFYPSNDAYYQKRKMPPADDTLQNNHNKHLDHVEMLKELGVQVTYVGEGQDRNVVFV